MNVERMIVHELRLEVLYDCIHPLSEHMSQGQLYFKLLALHGQNQYARRKCKFT